MSDSVPVIYGLVDADTLELRYVGKTVNDFGRRARQHQREIGHLGNWIRKVGARAVVLERDPPDLDGTERRWIAEMRAQGARLINATDGGTGGPPTAEARKKISATLSGRHLSAEHRANIRAALTGRRRPLEVVAKVAAANTGRHRSTEARERISAAHKGISRGPLSEETKAKISVAQRAYMSFPEHRARLSIVLKKRWGRVSDI